MMRKFLLCLTFLLLCTSVRATMPEEESKSTSTLVTTSPVMEETLPSLDKVMTAIIQVESKGNPKAYNKSGNCAGILQITPKLVKQCNTWLKEKKSKKRYTLHDRFIRTKSIEMFYMVQAHYNPENNPEKAIRVWNGGPNFSKKKTQGYYMKVMRHIK